MMGRRPEPAISPMAVDGGGGLGRIVSEDGEERADMLKGEADDSARETLVRCSAILGAEKLVGPRLAAPEAQVRPKARLR